MVGGARIKGEFMRALGARFFVVIACFHVGLLQAENFFERVRCRSITMAFRVGFSAVKSYARTPQVRSAAGYTGAGVFTGAMLGLGAAAGEKLGLFAILFRVLVGAWAGGLVGFGLHHYCWWKKEVDQREQEIKSSEQALEVLQMSANTEVLCAGKEVEATQKLFAHRSESLQDKIHGLEGKIAGKQQELTLRMDDVDARVNKGAQADDLERLKRDVVQLRDTIKNAATASVQSGVVQELKKHATAIKARTSMSCTT